MTFLIDVLGMRRSSSSYKANRRFAVGWNVGERKPYKAEGDWVFRTPRARTAPVVHIVYRGCRKTIFHSKSYRIINKKLPKVHEMMRFLFVFFNKITYSANSLYAVCPN